MNECVNEGASAICFERKKNFERKLASIWEYLSDLAKQQKGSRRRSQPKHPGVLDIYESTKKIKSKQCRK